MPEPRHPPAPAARREATPAERPRGARAEAAERHSGEGAASAWETWRQLERRHAKLRGEFDAAVSSTHPARWPGNDEAT